MHERDLLNAAFEIVDPTARREYLDQACAGNSALRVRVERLLSRAAQAADFLEQPANDLCSDFATGLLADASKPPLPSPSPVGMGDVAPAVGTLFGRYRVERELGSGGMGVVYLAEDLRLGRRVALKLPKFDAGGELHLTERFRREARTMASVQHRNLCPIFDVDEQDGTHYLTMSFIDGEPLSQVIRSRSRETSDRTLTSSATSSFTTHQIVELIRKLALGLEAAHRAGVVHRDLKPANVMIDRDGEPILMDFGLAWLVHEADSRVTQTGAVIGTPAYMSPEQAEGDPDKIGAATDIYSLGVILYELITGRPIRSGSVKQTLFKLMHEIPARPSEIRSDVDPRLEEICCKAIAPRPEDRFATAGEFAEALASFNNWGVETLVEPRAGDLRTGERIGSADRTGVLSQDEITIVDPKPQVARRSKSRIALLSLLLVGVLGAVLATIAQQRKVETLKPIASTRQADDGQVENLPHEIAPAKPQVPVDPGKPFVVVRDGKDLRPLKTLVSAINELQPGDIIEIRSNERLPIQFTEPITKPLAIRAGAGCRPMLAFVGPKKTLPIEDDFSVEGCDLDFRSLTFPAVNRTSTWRFHRCRMWGDPPGAVSKMRISESVIISLYGINAPTDGTSSDYEFDNCLIRNSNLLIRYAGKSSHTLRLRNCSFYRVSGGYPRLAHLREQAKLTVEATGNVFHCQSQANELIDPQSIPQVTWIGAHNCFSGTWYQIWEEQPDKTVTIKEKGLPAWNKLWKEPERDSREVDLLAFEWGRIQRLPNPERFSSVRAATEEMIAKNKLSEVGPDWNLVGAGEAYVCALAAEGRAVSESELRPERCEDGPIVLLRAGKEVRGYLTLKPALDAAQDQDIVELRTDGLVKDSHWTGDSRLLTIRAGAGYTPTIDGNLVSSGTDRLILEGLTIRYVLLASGGVRATNFGDGEQPLFPTQGSVVRMLNCTLLGETNNSVTDTWMFGDGDSIPEIVNCVFGTLRIGLRSGGKARLRNSMFGDCRPNVESRTAQPGTLEIDRCVFWLPEPALNVWAASLHSHSAITTQAHRSIFVSPVDLTFGYPRSIDWTGTGNVFVKSNGFCYGKDPLQLEQFQTQFQTEADSIELPPWEFDAAQWRILRDKSPGYQPRPDGTDYGADIDRLVNALGRDAVRAASTPGLNFVTGLITDTATVTIACPNVTKGLVGTSIVNSHNGSDQAVIGETVSYVIHLTVPEGVSPNVVINEMVPAGMAILNVIFVGQLPNGVTTSGGIALPSNQPIVVGAGGAIQLGTITNANTNNNQPETLTFFVNAVVLNVPGNQDGTQLVNQANVAWDDHVLPPISAAPVTVIEPLLTVDKSYKPDKELDAGDTVTFTITVSNLSPSSTDAYDVDLTDVLPAGFTYVGLPTFTGTAPAPSPFTEVGGVITAHWNVIPFGTSSTFTFQATLDRDVVPCQELTNTASTTWSSLPGTLASPGGPHLIVPGNLDSTERDGTGGVLKPYNDYFATDSTTVSVECPTLEKSIVTTSEASTIGNQVAIGEIVRYRLLISLPEGTSPNFQIHDFLPVGMQFLDGTAKVSLVSGAGFTSGLIGANQTLLAPPPTNVLLNNAVSTSATINNDSYGDGTDVFFKLGTLINNDNDGNAEYVVLEFNVLVLNTIANQAGVPLDNSYIVTIQPNASSIQVGDPSNVVTVIVVEPQLINIGKEYTSQTLPNGLLSATFDVSFSNANGPFSSTAFDTHVLDQLAPFLSLTPNTLTVIRNGFYTLGPSEFVNSSTSGTVDVTINQIAPGDTIQLFYTVTTTSVVQPTQHIKNIANVTYTSLPGTNGTSPNPTGSVTPGIPGSMTGERNGSNAPVIGSLNDYFDMSMATITAASPVISKTIIATSNASTGTSQFNPLLTDLAVAEYVTYQLTFTLPAGTTSPLIVRDNLPTGSAGVMKYFSSTIVSIGSGIGPGTLVPAVVTDTDGDLINDQVAYNFGTRTVAPGAAATRQIVVQVVAQVVNSAVNVLGKVLTNTANLFYGLGTISTNVNAEVGKRSKPWWFENLTLRTGVDVPLTPVRANPVDSSNMGDSVLSLVGSFVAAPNATLPLGIAVIGNDNSHGDWQISTDAGINWIAIGTTSPKSATLLSAEPNNREHGFHRHPVRGSDVPSLGPVGWSRQWHDGCGRLARWRRLAVQHRLDPSHGSGQHASHTAEHGQLRDRFANRNRASSDVARP
ncbi:MAG: protein kinase [Planctomycetia bacterium]|nr:protein kinase [Planctomycetia bacterium]